MYETNINIGNELYFFKGDKVFSNVTMKEVVDVHGSSRVCARDDGLLHVVRINRGEHPTEEVYDALGNKILKIKGMVVFGVTGCGMGNYLFSPTVWTADHFKMPFKYPYRVTKHVVIQYDEKENTYQVSKKNGTKLAKGKECALFQVASGEYFALLNEEGTWDLYNQNGKMDPKIQGMKSIFYAEYKDKFECQHPDRSCYFEVETEHEKQKRIRNTILFYAGLGAFLITGGYLSIKGVKNHQEEMEQIEKTPARVLWVTADDIYFDTDGNEKTAELRGEVPLSLGLSAGFSLGLAKGKGIVQPISKWRMLNGLQDMVVERCK